MKVDTQKRDIQAGGLIGRKNFTVQAGAHIMAVLSGLYKEPIDAMVREYLTNMYDAVAALRRKNPTAEILPAVLGLPTGLAPELVFKDYGIGMSCDTVMEVYSQYGNSTKNDSNLEVGGFGLGSKTAFCYNNGSTWTIESRHDGQKHVFMASIGEEGIPFLAHVSSTATDEHSGVTIRIPVLRHDMTKCYDAAARYVPYFTLPITVEGDRRISEITKKVEYTVKGEGWGIRTIAAAHYGSQEWRIVMGNVPYTVNWYDLNLGGSGEFYRNPFDLYVPIGSVDIVPSRDSLKMTDRTRNAIITAMKGVVTELQKILSASIQSAPTYWEALVAYTNLTTIRGAKDVVSGVKWQGKEVDLTKGVVVTFSELRKLDPNVTVTEYGVTNIDRSTIEVKEHTKGSDELRLRTEHAWLIIEDMPKGVSRVKSHLYDNLVNFSTGSSGKRSVRRSGHKIGHALLVNTKLTPAQLSVAFGGFPVARMMKMSDMKVGKLPASAKSTVDTIYRWNGSQWEARVNIPTDKKYFLILEKNTYVGRFVWKSAKAVYDPKNVTVKLIEYAETLGLSVGVGDLYGVKSDEVSKIDTTIFTNLYDAIQAKALAHAKAHAREWVIAPTVGTLVPRETTWTKLFTKFGAPAVDVTFSTFADTLTEREQVRAALRTKNFTDGDFLSPATKDAVLAVKNSVVVEDATKLATTLQKKYPLLTMFVDALDGGFQWRADELIIRHKNVLLDFWNAPR